VINIFSQREFPRQNCQKKISELYQTISKPVAVLAAGPSLPDDLISIFQKKAVYIGINHHAERLVDLDFIVFTDRAEDVPGLKESLKSHKNKISMSNDSDYLLDVPYWKEGMTASLAIWFACFAAKKEILLCGFDLWESNPSHFYKHSAGVGHLKGNLDHKINVHAKAWDECFKPERIRAVSGPLTQIF